jgi:hypothetical protein
VGAFEPRSANVAAHGPNHVKPSTTKLVEKERNRPTLGVELPFRRQRPYGLDTERADGQHLHSTCTGWMDGLTPCVSLSSCSTRNRLLAQQVNASGSADGHHWAVHVEVAAPRAHVTVAARCSYNRAVPGWKARLRLNFRAAWMILIFGMEGCSY